MKNTFGNLQLRKTKSTLRTQFSLHLPLGLLLYLSILLDSLKLSQTAFLFRHSSSKSIYKGLNLRDNSVSLARQHQNNNHNVKPVKQEHPCALISF